MNYKKLEKEGLTKELLDSIPLKKIGNPVQLLPNDDPVNLVKCARGFWISINGELVKDAENNYLVVSDEAAIIGRARYLLNFKEEIEKQTGKLYEAALSDKIKKETERLKELTHEKVKTCLGEIKFLLQLAGKIETDLSFSLKKLVIEENETLEEAIIEANRVVEIDLFEESYHTLKKWFDEGNYDDLYSYFFQNGAYEIANFQENDIDVMRKFFRADKIDETLESIRSNSHLENVARFNVEKALAAIK
jgi:hypothetical protein